jgi:hypothetical protein
MWPIGIHRLQAPGCDAIQVAMSSHARGLTPAAAAVPVAVHCLQTLIMLTAPPNIMLALMRPARSWSRIQSVIPEHQALVGVLAAVEL